MESISGTSGPGVIALGPHRLIQGDGTDPSVLARLLGGDKAAMVFTDPPYNVNYGARSRVKGGHVPGTILNDKLGAGFPAFLRHACAAMLGACDGAVYICMSTSELAALQAAFTAAGGHQSTFIVWVKPHFALQRSDYHRRFEAILYGWRRGVRRQWHGGRRQDDVWPAPIVPPWRRRHPTEKPVSLIARAIENSSKPGDWVLDPFGGSGATLEACERTGRRAALVELDPKFCRVIEQRWRELLERPALL